MAAGGRGGSGPADAISLRASRRKVSGSSRWARLSDVRVSGPPRATPPNRRLVPREELHPNRIAARRSGNDSLTTSSLDAWTRRAPRSATAVSTLADLGVGRRVIPATATCSSAPGRKSHASRRHRAAGRTRPAHLARPDPVTGTHQRQRRRRMCLPRNPLTPEPRTRAAKVWAFAIRGIGPQTVGEAPLRSLTHGR